MRKLNPCFLLPSLSRRIGRTKNTACIDVMKYEFESFEDETGPEIEKFQKVGF